MDQAAPALADRYRPSRAGIVNLWDYRDEEFVFADGRLVLRGPNGSGKTKALEVLFPFVLDGRIEPRRLNPFASEDRTMKSNLLYRGQESAYSYVWLEFACGDSFVTVGVGLRAQKHNDRVTRWYFVVDGRAGVDFSLLGQDDRPLTRKQLAAELGPDALTDRPGDHRAAIDARLFGLGIDRYEQLLTLVLTLRRPQLAKHLDPKGLSRTLADGLRPLDDGLIAEAARSFDDMESVQRTLRGLVAADEAARTFLTSYVTYLRTHARAAADVVGGRLAAVEDARAALATALTRHRDATRLAGDAERAVGEAEAALGKQRAHLDSLRSSKAYTAKEQLDKLVELVGRLESAARTARRRADEAAAVAERRERELATTREAFADAAREVTRGAAQVADAAHDAGIAWGAQDSDADDVDDRVAARLVARRDDLAAVREVMGALDRARAERSLLDAAFGKAEEAVGTAESLLHKEDGAVEAARAAAGQALGDWWSRHEATVTELALSEVDARLAAALTRVGEPDEPGLAEVFDALTATPVEDRRDALRELRRQRGTADDELAGLRGQRAAVAAERDDAPAPFAARTADRTGRPGGPLWRLVRFADDVPADRAAAVEAALEAANLLDAWLQPDSVLDANGSDAHLVPLPVGRRPPGPTLADVLVPEDEAPVDAARIADVLSSVALAEVVDATGEPPVFPAVSPRGGFAQGIQVGAHAKDHAEYIGATARARRRAARLAELDDRITTAAAVIAELDRGVVAAQELLAAVTAARGELPPTRGIRDALRGQAEAAVALRIKREHLDDARRDLDGAVAAVGDRERRLTRVAADRALPPDRDGIARVDAAVGRFAGAAADLTSARRQERTLAGQVGTAERELRAAQENAVGLADEAGDKETEHAEQAEGLATLRATVGADVEDVLRQVAATRDRIDEWEHTLRARQKEHRDAFGEAKAAGEAVSGATATLTTAITEAQNDARRLAPYAHRELLDLLRVPAGVGWPGTETAWQDPAGLAAAAAAALVSTPDSPVGALPGAVVELQDAIASVTTELRPTEASLKSSKTRVSKALDEMQAQLSAAGHDYRPEWQTDDDVIIVRVADEHGFAPIGAFADRITAARRDQELLLTESERRILEDALLGRLAQQIHERTIDARDLIGRMASEMRTRRMSSGAGVGVHWELADSLDEEGRAVSRLLERHASRLGPDELARMRAHFASRIKNARAQHRDRAYADLLAEVLDYRRWRVFAFTLVSGEGGEERLTQSRHSTLSGGEQSVSLHLPLFAAAHVMLSSAAPTCPRLLALDEAFAGVDDNGRRELLGLTAQFDLDLFMTGYDLWATYDTVPACAHYDLSHSAAEHTVSALLLVWDGKEILADSPVTDLAAALGSPGRRRRLTGDGMLTGEFTVDGEA
ncbi:TIGR02680 family protein [Actinophytocola glycyrrhizae]|uniref:TIGR02680 family protein n=1 Tax=Actinophytocola glycyrrhizae TaxID=2044873 RepID=A0ABV9SA62_9PSEU